MSFCTWCGDSFEPRGNGGKPQKFCSAPCRREFEAACRVYAAAEVEAGRLSVSALKYALQQRAHCLERDLPQEATEGAPEAQRRPAVPLAVHVARAI